MRRSQQLAAGRSRHGQRPAARRPRPATGRPTTTPCSRRWTARAARCSTARRCTSRIRRSSPRTATPTATASPTSRGRSSAGSASASISAAPTTPSTASRWASTAGSTSPSATTASSRPSAPTARRSRCAAAATCACAPTAPSSRSTARGTRNDYDVAIDPYLNLFARGNTNDGGGWDIRLNHFVAGRQVRLSVALPQLRRRGRRAAGRLRRRVRDRHAVRPGSGPAGAVRRHAVFGRLGDELHLSPSAYSRAARRSLPGRKCSSACRGRPTSCIDGASRLYVASWKGGQYRYGGEQIGYIARLTYPGAKAVAGARTSRPRATRGSSSSSRRTIRCTAASRSTSSCAAGRRRSASRCSRSACSAPDRCAGRVAAIFTLKQLAGADSHAVLIKAAADPAVREFALRALADRRERAGQRAEGALRAGARRRRSPRAAAGHHRAQAAGRVDAAGAIAAAHRQHRSASVAHVAIDALVVARRVRRGARAC